jgi:hypothetical protein
MNDEIVNADDEDGQLAGEAIVEAVESQLAQNEPPETKGTNQTPTLTVLG